MIHTEEFGSLSPPIVFEVQRDRSTEYVFHDDGHFSSLVDPRVEVVWCQGVCDIDIVQGSILQRPYIRRLGFHSLVELLHATDCTMSAGTQSGTSLDAISAST